MSLDALRSITKFRFTLVAQQVLFSSTLAVAAVLASGYLGYQYTLSSLENQFEQKFQLLAKERQARIESFVGQQYERIRLISSRTRLRKLLEDHHTESVSQEIFLEGTQRILEDALNSTTDFLEINVVNTSGVIITSTNPEEIGHLVDDPLIFHHGGNREYLEEPKHTNGLCTCRLYSSLYSATGQQLGVMLILLNAAELMDILKPDDLLGGSSEMCIGRLHGEELHTLLPTESLNGDLANVMRQAIRGGTGFGAMNHSNSHVLAYWAPFTLQENEAARWGFVAMVDIHEALQPIRDFRNRVYQLIGLILLASIGFAYLGTRGLTRPLRRLTAAANDLAEHQRTTLVDESSNDEVGDLTKAFNVMAAELTRKHNELQSYTDQLRHLNTMYEQELDLAAKIQEALYPKVSLNCPGFEVHGLTQAAEKLCGDYFDYFWSQDGTFTIALGDVSGHGAGPALLMVETRAIIHSFIANQVPLRNWGKQLNDLLYDDSPEGRFVSLFIAQIDPKTLQMRYIGAGHHAWIIAADGEVDVLGSTSIPLGMDETTIPVMKETQLNKQDLLFVASDGLYEVKNLHDDMYGTDRLLQFINQHQSLPLSQLLEEIVKSVHTHAETNLFKDDLTMVAVRVSG